MSNDNDGVAALRALGVRGAPTVEKLQELVRTSSAEFRKTFEVLDGMGAALDWPIGSVAHRASFEVRQALGLDEDIPTRRIRASIVSAYRVCLEAAAVAANVRGLHRRRRIDADRALRDVAKAQESAFNALPYVTDLNKSALADLSERLERERDRPVLVGRGPTAPRLVFALRLGEVFSLATGREPTLALTESLALRKTPWDAFVRSALEITGFGTMGLEGMLRAMRPWKDNFRMIVERAGDSYLVRPLGVGDVFPASLAKLTDIKEEISRLGSSVNQLSTDHRRPLGPK